MKKGLFFLLFLMTGAVVLLISIGLTAVQLVPHKHQTSPLL